MKTLSEAIALDQALKAVSSRLFVLYRPYYRDQRDRYYPAAVTVRLQDPDDATQSESFSHVDGSFFVTAAEGALLAAPRREQALEIIKQLDNHEKNHYWDPQAIVTDANCEPVRVDTLDANKVACDADRVERRETAREEAQDCSDQIDPHRLKQEWAQRMLAHVALRQRNGIGAPFSSANNEERHRVDSESVMDCAIAEATVDPETFPAYFDREQLVATDPGHQELSVIWMRTTNPRPEHYVRAEIDGSLLYVRKAEDGRFQFVTTDVVKLANWCGLPNEFRRLGWYCGADKFGGLSFWRADA
ncbi:hypothetical protein [Lacticaseibacillus sp. GG6-2]